MEDICGICGARHHPRQAHRFGVVEDRPSTREQPVVTGPVGPTGKKQRWSREAYNAYQRDYMRRRRSV